MTADGVHPFEMPTPDDLDERTVEAFLTGRSVATGEAAALSVFADDLRVAVSGPPPAPTPALASLMTKGFSVDDNQLAAAAHGTYGAALPTPSRPTQRRRKMTISGFLAALAAKLAGLGAAAKVALGATLATATAATAGAVGVLPDPAQRAVAAVVNATPFQIPDGTENDDAGTGIDVNDAIPPVVGDGIGDDTTDGDPTGDDATATGDNHGACVSAVAREAPRGAGGVHGEAVSSAAKTCPKGTDPDEEPTTTTTTTTIASDDDVAGVTSSGPGNGGQGNGNGGQGSANSGPGGGGGNGGQGNSNSGPGNSGGRGR